VALDGDQRFFRIETDDMGNREYEPVPDDKTTDEDDPPASNREQAQRRTIALRDPYRLGALEQTVTYDWRNDPLDPRWGAYGSVTVSEGAAAFGSRLPFARGTADLRAYVPILRVFGFRDRRRRLVLAGRAFYGRVLGSEPLPLTERFFDGGAAGHRGFTFQQLSPTVTEEVRLVEEDPAVDPPTPVQARIGGEEQFLGSAEARIDIADIKTYPFGVVLFTDAGDVLARAGDLDLTNLHYAAGFGLRWSPVVSIRLDFGYRLNRHGAGEPSPNNRFAFHFSLGQAF
jgi:outer membrane protein assembly factor BamA